MNIMEREKALTLLLKYNEEKFHIQHALTVEQIMRWYAKELGYDEDYWGLVGLLHDLDYEKYPQEHCIKVVEILRAENYEDNFIRAICSHGYNIMVDIKPEHVMEKVLYAVDELSGLIGAAAKMRPSKSVSDMELKSLKKKFKDKSFAAGCSRDVIRTGAEMLGWELDELFSKTLEAMRLSEQQVKV
ncbi:MAG: HDIG domain-containing protein [Tannerellaceae bacterium]|nr:HDIG domain-containing protein [Tannerellaceae bacterium]